MLVLLFSLVLLVALRVAPTVWRRWRERQRISHCLVQTQVAQTEWLAQRAGLVQALCDRLAERGLLQRQVRETLQMRASELTAAQRRAVQRPQDPHALASWLQADAAFRRAIARTLDSVRPETLLEPQLQRLTQSLSALDACLKGGWTVLAQTTPAHHASGRRPSFGDRRARPRPWHPDAGWA